MCEDESSRTCGGGQGERERDLPLILALQGQKLSEICGFEAHLVFTANSRLEGAHSHSVT